MTRSVSQGRAMRKLAVAVMLGWAATAVEAEGPKPVLVAKWQVSADGSEVRDPHTGLTWSRCLEGVHWDGQRCAGLPRMLTHREALDHGRAKGAGWRLPRVPELQRVLVHAPAQNEVGQALFPDVPGAWLWTATAHVNPREVNAYDYGNVQRGVTRDNAVQMNFLHGWAVHQPGGQVDGQVLKRQRLAVRWVR